MTGLLGTVRRDRPAIALMLVGLLFLFPASVNAEGLRAEDPMDLHAPITFQFSGSLELEPTRPVRPARPALPPMTLADPGLNRSSQVGVDAFLARVAPGEIQRDQMARKVLGLSEELEPLTGPTPVPTPLAISASSAVPAMRLTTRLGHSVRTLGEFRTRDWNALGEVTPLSGPGASTAEARPTMRLPSVDMLALSAPAPHSRPQAAAVPAEPAETELVRPPESSRAAQAAKLAETVRPPESGRPLSAAALPDASKPSARPSLPDTSDTGPAAMAEAERALADAQDRGTRKARSRGRPAGETLMVLPDFGTSSFQVGASFSLAGRSGGRIAFGEKPSGPFEQGLGTRQSFGLSAPGAGESLRLSNPDEPAPATKPAKDDAEQRLWTGVSFNF